MKDENFIIDLCGLNLVSFAAFYYRFSFLDYISNVFTMITNVIFEALKCKLKQTTNFTKKKKSAVVQIIFHGRQKSN